MKMFISKDGQELVISVPIRFLKEKVNRLPKKIIMQRGDNALNYIHFTRREREVLKHLLLDQANKEIANHLSISERTVKAHVSNIFLKTGLGRRSLVFNYGESIQ